MKTFLGAGGGAIIGDAIFPGLGTVGGALLGAYGGKKASERSRSGRRDRYDDDAEEYRRSQR